LCAAFLVSGVASGEARYKEKILYSFKGGSDGTGPGSALVADVQGDLYGATFSGGGSGCNGFGCGTVFKLTPKGQETVLYAFRSGGDGAGPDGPLIMDAQGNLYGTAGYGGIDGCEVGCGTIFEVTPQGHETVLYAFAGFGDGSNPVNGLLADAQGNFYGTALGGGPSVFGEVFQVSPKGAETVLYSFTGGADGGDPDSGLIADAEGDLYGTGYVQGGCAVSCNTVFKVTPQGSETVFHDFARAKKGTDPVGVIADAAGNFYGTTEYGAGRSCGGGGCGTVFKLDPAGKEIVLHTFGRGNDGVFPAAGLLADSQGNLYGTTIWGGGGNCPHGCGTVFEVTPNGEETVLHAFAGGTDGQGPEGALIADAQGNLYGTTAAGGSSKNGTVFELTKN
jgi:uncharacterized repeat protein (TIGR03803 family)